MLLTPPASEALDVNEVEQNTQSTRKKRRTPRSRTGCNTCRTRRIKCDEKKPICTPCWKTDQKCEGYFYGGNSGTITSRKPLLAITGAAIKDTRITSTQLVHVSNEEESHPVIVSEPRLQGWDYMDARRYYGCIRSLFVEIIPAAFAAPKRKDPDPEYTNLLIASVLNHRILQMSRTKNSLALPTWSPETAPLWTAMHTRLGQLLKSINRTLNDGLGAYEQDILSRILHIATMENILGLPTWRMHREGFLAFVHTCGGPKYVINRTTLSVRLDLQRVVVDSFISNAVGPPHDQLKGTSAFKMDEIKTIYNMTSEPNFPCPTELFLQIVAITRLRVELFDGLSILEAQPRIDAIYNSISKFSPEFWTEKYPLPDRREVPIFAGLFKLTTTIFATATLPPSNSELYNWSAAHRSLLKDRALYLLQDLWREPECHGSLCWPLAVTGFALANGPSTQQDEISSMLLGLYTSLAERCTGALIARNRLLTFWASGLTGWDECWQELFKLLE